MAPSPSVSLISSGHHPFLLLKLVSCWIFPLMFSSFSLSPLGLSRNLKTRTTQSLLIMSLPHQVPALPLPVPSPSSPTVCTIHLLFTAPPRCDSSITQALAHQTQLLLSHLFILSPSCLRRYWEPPLQPPLFRKPISLVLVMFSFSYSPSANGPSLWRNSEVCLFFTDCVCFPYHSD